MFLVVSIGKEGNFIVNSLSKRERVIQQIKENDIEYWNINFMDIASEYNVYSEDEIISLDEEGWYDFVSHYERLGKVEIQDIKITI